MFLFLILPIFSSSSFFRSLCRCPPSVASFKKNDDFTYDQDNFCSFFCFVPPPRPPSPGPPAPPASLVVTRDPALAVVDIETAAVPTAQQQQRWQHPEQQQQEQEERQEQQQEEDDASSDEFPQFPQFPEFSESEEFVLV
jgi:hypothetical protein